LSGGGRDADGSSGSGGSGGRIGDNSSWDRCYDFLNIFAEKFSEKIGGFDSKQS
jgi:hypothetical protein